MYLNLRTSAFCPKCMCLFEGPEGGVKDPHLLQDHDQHNNSVVLLEHMSASWSLDKNKLSLNNINLEVTLSAPLLAVVGPVGSGKVRTLFGVQQVIHLFLSPLFFSACWGS